MWWQWWGRNEWGRGIVDGGRWEQLTLKRDRDRCPPEVSVGVYNVLTEQQSLNLLASVGVEKLSPHSLLELGSRQCTKHSVAGQMIVPANTRKHAALLTAYPCNHPSVYTHTHTDTQTHRHTHTRTHARTHARSHARTHARTHVYIHLFSRNVRFTQLHKISQFYFQVLCLLCWRHLCWPSSAVCLCSPDFLQMCSPDFLELCSPDFLQLYSPDFLQLYSPDFLQLCSPDFLQLYSPDCVALTSYSCVVLTSCSCVAPTSCSCVVPISCSCLPSAV